MPTLIVDFHCMCLFVPDSEGGAVHVLLPAMHGPGHHAHEGAAGAAAPEEHVACMRHRSFGADPLGRSIAGWALTLGAGSPNLDLNRSSAPELPDLTALTQRTVDPQVLRDGAQQLTSRVVLRGGAVAARDSDPYRWTLAGRENLRLANRVTWVLPDVPDELAWEGLGHDGSPPLRSLRELEPEAENLYRIGIHHETEGTLRGGGLGVAEMQHHFAAYYTLLGMHPPDNRDPDQARLLPALQGGGGGSVMCRSAMARIG